MQSIETLSIKEIYKIHNRLPVFEENGLKQYPILKKYADPQKQFNGKSLLQSKTKKNLRLRTYLDQEQKKNRNKPGPGNYNIGIDWKMSQQKKVNSHDRLTFLDEIIRKVKRNKSPGPGQHQQVQINHSKSFLRINQKHQKSKQRLFYYDQGQYSASKQPGPGSYNVILPQSISFRHNRETPEQNIKNFRIKSQKKLKSITKLPDMGTYNPEDNNLFTFKAADKVKPYKKSFGIGKRFKTEPTGSGLSPNKYQVINQWKGKQSNTKTYQKQGLDILSKPQSRIYN